MTVPGCFRRRPRPERAPEWAVELAEHITRISHTQERILSTISDLAAADQQVADELAVIGTSLTKLEADFAALAAGVGDVTSLSTEDQATVDGLVSQAQGSLTALQNAAAGIVATDPAAAPAPPAEPFGLTRDTGG